MTGSVGKSTSIKSGGVKLVLCALTSHLIEMMRSYRCYPRVIVSVMVLNATFNNISAIPWLSVLFMEEIGVPGENHQPAASHTNFII